MRNLRILVIVALGGLIFNSFVLAQDDKSDVIKPSKLSLGFKMGFGYAPNPWRYMKFSKIPESLRQIKPEGTYVWETVGQDQVKLHDHTLLTFDLGFSIASSNRFQMSFGPSLAYLSSAPAVAEYSRNEAFYQITARSLLRGMYADVSVGINKMISLSASASSYPTYRPLNFETGQGKHEMFYGQSGYAAHSFGGFPFGEFRYPLMILAGVRFCPWFDEKDMSNAIGGFTIMAGPAYRQIKLLPSALGTQVNEYEKIFIIRFGLDGSFPFWSKKRR